MTRRMKFLIALDATLAPTLLVVIGLIPANFPSVSGPLFWSITGAIFVFAVAVNIVVAISKADKKEAPSTPSYSLASQSSVQPSTFSWQRRSSSMKKGSLQDTTKTSPKVLTTLTSTKNGQALVSQSSIEHPMLICLAIDVSYSMKKPIFDQTGKVIERWASLKEALEHFVHLGVAWFKDPETQRVLPLYHLMAYGFGFTETAHKLGATKKPGGMVRDLLLHPSFPSLPSAEDISEHWSEYRDNLLSFKKYTCDLFGTSPLYRGLVTIRDRIREERTKIPFTRPTLLLIISDGVSDDGNPIPIIQELHDMDVMTLCCYLADKDVLAAKRLYDAEDANWSQGAKLLFQCSSPLQKDNNISQAIFNYLSDAGWQPHEGVRLFAQINQTDGLNTFLEILLHSSLSERSE